MIKNDAYDLPVTTSSIVALESFDAAVDAQVAWKASALGLYKRATELDPELAVAHAGLAVVLLHADRPAEAMAAAEAARAAANARKVTARERSYVEALNLFVSFRWVECEGVIREHLKTYPRDISLLWRLYEMLFWEGRPADMLDLTTQIVERYPADAYVGGLHAFAVGEAGRLTEAARLAESAIARKPEDAWAVHALAHALYDSGSFRAGLRAIPPAIEACVDLGNFAHHVWWHVIVMHLGTGDYTRANELAHRHMEHKPSPYTIDLHDSMSFLWRLELLGKPAGERWKPFAGFARERIGSPGLPFTMTHLAMALVGSGDWGSAEKHLVTLKEFASKDETKVLGEVVVPLVEGLHAFGAQDYARVISKIEPIRDRIVQVGGSRAQRDVFHDTLFEAAFRAGDGDRIKRYVVERVARRPDHHWIART